METSLTSALIIRRSRGVAVCWPEKLTHMQLRPRRTRKDAPQRWCGGKKKTSFFWPTQINTSSLSRFLHKEAGFLSLQCSLLFFFLLPSAAHNSEQYMMAALKHRSGFRAGQDSSPSALCVEYCTGLNSACGRGEYASTPFLF